jgi:hypothetical protein
MEPVCLEQLDIFLELVNFGVDVLLEVFVIF